MWVCAVCLDLHCAPKGDWHCPYCRDKFGPGRKSAAESLNMGRPIKIRLTRVVEAPEYETGGCVVCRLVTIHVAIQFNSGFVCFPKFVDIATL